MNGRGEGFCAGIFGPLVYTCNAYGGGGQILNREPPLTYVMHTREAQIFQNRKLASFIHVMHTRGANIVEQKAPSIYT